MEKTRIDNRQARVQGLALLLIWEGRLGRARLIELFGLSPVRASEWIREFRLEHEDWTAWDSRSKSFRATEVAYRAWSDRRLASDSNRDNGFASYLAQVGLSPAGADEPDAPLCAAFRDFVAPQPRVFAALRGAIERRRCIEITYRSMRDPKPHRRVLEPHGLVRAGPRWHVRAYSLTDAAFRDYSLGRIVAAKLLDQNASHSAEDDAPWQASVRVVIAPHPDLNDAQADVVRFEYFQGAASRIESCRGALVPYLIQDLRAATDPARQRPPDYQLAVTNFREVSPWLFPT